VTTGDVVFVGGGDDARGFRLAGVAAVAPTREGIAAAVDRWLTADAGRPALVIVSAESMAAAPDRLSALEAYADGPIVVILPDRGPGAGTASRDS
jgi:vacuolar-type H+-ATPase subunit F/Vma7